jgi:adenine phosphoribosyltransferase
MPTSLADRIHASLRPIPDYPRLGTTFLDSTPVFRQGGLLKEIVSAMAEPFKGAGVTHVLGIEPQGQILGGAVAVALGAGFISARKPRKLPWIQIRQVYALEYGGDRLEARRDDFKESDRVLVVDDLLASGGTAEAAGQLVRALHGMLAGYSFMIEQPTEAGRGRLGDVPVHAVVKIP